MFADSSKISACNLHTWCTVFIGLSYIADVAYKLSNQTPHPCVYEMREKRATFQTFAALCCNSANDVCNVPSS